jgi:hypothetical protein
MIVTPSQMGMRASSAAAPDGMNFLGERKAIMPSV